MKLIEKTCPKCGANLEFTEGEKKVKCAYCNTSFLIEEDKNAANGYHLINKAASVAKTVIITSSIIFVVIVAAIVAIVISINHSFSKIDKPDFDFFHQLDEKSDDIFEDDKPKFSLKDISTEDQEKLAKKSLAKIKEWQHPVFVNFIGNKHLGIYLSIEDGETKLYDVFELQYSDDTNVYNVYTAVEYNDPSYKNKTLTTDSGNVFGGLIRVGNETLWGYDSIETLYGNIDTSYSDKITATEGLYIG